MKNQSLNEKIMYISGEQINLKYMCIVTNDQYKAIFGDEIDT